jgi:hypothetical protein
MRRQAGIAAVSLALIATASAESGEYIAYGQPRSHFLSRLGPSGGCNPGGGLLHWWDPNCLPGACGPNDYCRKPLPNLCRYPIHHQPWIQAGPHTHGHGAW